MGRGVIKSHLGAGLYSVELTYAYRNRVEDRIAGYEQQISILDTKISEETDAIKKQILLLQKKSVEKQKEYYETNMPADPTVEAWCADRTESLTGTVGTIEIPGEPTTVMVRPGYNNRAVYSQSRDGQLMPSISGAPNQVMLNWMLLPGWQRHKPTYRVGTIVEDSIDYSSNTCSVCLDPAYSSQQTLPVVDGLATGVCSTDNPVERQVNDFCSRYPSHPMCTNSVLGSEIFLTDAMLEQLKEVNSYVNQNYGRKNDASGIRMGDSWDVMGDIGGEGDCEDFALTKMQMLSDRYGWSGRDLKIATSYAASGDYHALLIVRTSNKGIVALDVNYENVMTYSRLPYRLDKIGLTKSLWQSYSRRMDNVPIEYMHCNAYAFLGGDRVVVQFLSQQWASPKVIGFESDPQACVWGAVCFPGNTTGFDPVQYAVRYRPSTGTVSLGADIADRVLDPESEFFEEPVYQMTTAYAAASAAFKAYKFGGYMLDAGLHETNSINREYDPIADSTALKTDVPYSSGENVGFSADSYAFVAFGTDNLDLEMFNDVFRFLPSTETWATRQSCGTALRSARCFVIDGIAYFLGGTTHFWMEGVPTSDGDFREKYNNALNAWSTYGASPGFRIFAHAAFMAGEKGYVAGGMRVVGDDWEYAPDCSQYDPLAESWRASNPNPNWDSDPFSGVSYPSGADGVGGDAGWVFDRYRGTGPDYNKSQLNDFDGLNESWGSREISGTTMYRHAATTVV